MKKYFATMAATLGALVAVVGSAACVAIILDEPKMPKSLIEK